MTGNKTDDSVTGVNQLRAAGKFVPRLVPCALLLIGIVLVVLGTVNLVSAIHLEFSASKAKGRVIRDITVSGSHYPLVRFITPDEKTVEFRGSVGSRPADYAVGDQVTVLYWPDHPESATIRSFLEMWCLPVVLIPIGLLLLAIFTFSRGDFS